LRRLRKHRVALAAIAVANFVLFFPVVFMRRVISANDVFYSYDPWALARGFDIQNWQLNDPPTAWYPVMALMKSGRFFHWDPFIGSGAAGWGSSGSALFSPFVALPVLLTPLAWVFTAMIFLKLNAAFYFAYFWLREERLGKRGAAVGAIVFAASGAFAVRWMWQLTNATVLYPALLWIVRRIARGRRVPFAAIALVALAYALAAFPATMAYGAYIALLYFVVLVIRERRLPLRATLAAAGAVVLALVIASPSLVPYIQFIGRSGYLGVRETLSRSVFPAHHALAFVKPDRLGNPAYHNWTGDLTLPVNNYIEATVYLGIIALPLVALAFFSRRARMRWFWILATATIVAAMFGVPGITRAIGALPGVKYSPLTRLQMLLPLGVAYLAAAGTIVIARRRFATTIALVLAVLAATDLSVFAGRFFPYLRPSDTTVPSTPTIAYLQAQPKPFRIAPMFPYLWPNASELYGLEDIRSHFASEAAYRRMMTRIDPSAWNGMSTVITFNSLHFDFADPFVSMLGVRYYVEQRSIDIMRWKIFESTVPGVKESGGFTMKSGDVVTCTIPVRAEPFYAIELPASMTSADGTAPRLFVSLLKDDATLWTRGFTPEDLAALGKVYVPVRPYARAGDMLHLSIEAFSMHAALLGAERIAKDDAPFFWGRVTKPLIFDRDLPDGRVFMNVGELPRFHAVTRVRRMSEDAFFADKSIDFAEEAIVTSATAPLPPAAPAPATVRIVRTSDADYELVANGAAPYFIASSEKLTPELRVTIDGREVTPVPINALFAGVAVPAGEHRIVFSRRIARGWWGWSAFAALLLLALSVADVTAARRRG
jgi:hypothetical protein